MENFKRLFVAFDFSPNSDEALREAHNRARSTGAQLAVCHAVPNEIRNNVLFPQDTRNEALRFPREMRKIGEVAAARVTEVTGRPEGEYELLIDDGTPHAVILDQAESWLADLIVLGSHGHTRPSDARLGSVTHSVVRHAHCPVLIVRPGEQAGCVVVGTDFSDPSLPALRAAANESERTGAPLVAVHSLDLVWSIAAYPAMAFGGTPFNVSAEEIAELSMTATERLKEALRHLNIQGEVVVTTGAAGTAILEIASERKASLIVVGTIGRTGLRRALLGSVAETVIGKATCSALVVRRHPE